MAMGHVCQANHSTPGSMTIFGNHTSFWRCKGPPQGEETFSAVEGAFSCALDPVKHLPTSLHHPSAKHKASPAD